MLYFEDYVIVNKGIKPDNNQDNIYVNGIFLSEKNNGLNNYTKKINYRSKNLIYAVFDGVGGMDRGEYASYICSKVLCSNINNNINDTLNIINNKIIKINKDENIKMGSTASIIKIKRNKLCISQVGDSPIYILSKGIFTKVSDKKEESNILNNYLGNNNINITNRVFDIKNGDKILICSDGLTNEVGELEIEYILDQSDDSKYISDKLLNYALINGGNDNISIITIVVKRNYHKIIYILSLIVIVIILFIIFS